MNPSIFGQHTGEIRHHLAAILAEHLFKGLSISDVLKMYDDLATPNKNQEKEPADLGFTYDRFGDREIHAEIINVGLVGLQNIGVDFPILFAPPESLFTIMLVGMEPLRADDNSNKATIGAPFALHQERQSSSGSKIKTFRDFYTYIRILGEPTKGLETLATTGRYGRQY
jgi:hypothetical protein